MKLLLVLSLSVNVAVVGMIGGTMMRGHDRAKNIPGLDYRQSRILRMVPEARRDEALTILLGRRDDIEDARAAMRTSQQALIMAIRQEPFAPDELAAALAARREASGRMWGIGYQQVAEIAEKLNAAERAVLADRLEERTRRWRERQKRWRR